MARMVSGKALPWQRFWVPQGGKISAGDDGRSFLDDPEGEFGLSRNPDVVKIGDLLQRSCVVLSGQPGIGKTVEFDSLRDRCAEWLASDEALIDFHCRHVTSPEALRLDTVESPQWKKTLENGGKIRLLIDGVDEALSRVSVLVPAIAQWLRDEPLDRISVILVCRSAEWHLADTNALRELWREKNENIVFELCPLRWKDAELAALESGVDPQAFWQEIIRHQVQGLAARPITLGMLLEEMNDGGNLPSSHHQLFTNAIARICRENPERVRYSPRPRPNQAHIQRVASRIAMLLMIGGRSVVARDGDDAQVEELLVSEIATGTETVGGETFSVTPELVAVTLDTALFSFRGADRYGFDHQTFAEHLAADYLRDCSLTQLRRLLCVSLGGREFVAPQIAEIAARVGLTNETWCDHLIASEPEILLRADASQLDATQKEQAVANLLKRAEQEEAFDGLGSTKFYHTLKHPRLGEQLRKYINEPKHNYVVRRMAFEIAGDARVTELEADLWNRVKEDDPCLNNICHALADIAGPASREPLIAALRGEIKDNSVLDLKGLALSKLVPERFTIREVLPFLTSQPADTISGMYQMELRYRLPAQVTIDD